MPGPVPKLNRVRARDNKVREYIAPDGKIRGFDLPDDALEVGEEWHPRVVAWWDAFRRSPQAQLVVADVQWETLLSAMRTYQDLWTGKSRGRSLRAAEFRQLLTHYLVTPADARRSGIEFVLPSDLDDEPPLDAGNVASLADRRVIAESSSSVRRASLICSGMERLSVRSESAPTDDKVPPLVGAFLGFS